MYVLIALTQGGWGVQNYGKHADIIRDGISAEKKFRISDDLFRIHLGRASISAKFRLICINFG